MRASKTGFLPVDAGFPFEGLDVVTPSTQLPPGASPSNLNLTTFRGTLQKRAGHTAYQTGIDDEPVIKLIQFTDDDLTGYLIAVTPANVYKYTDVGWQPISPTAQVVKFTKLSGGNGWSVAGGTLTPGDIVFQGQSNALGMWLAPDASYYYVAILYGVFDAIHGIFNNLGGNIELTGSDPNAVSTTIAEFPITIDETTKWGITTGYFDPGDTVSQTASGSAPGATGIWLTPGVYVANKYCVVVSSGTFYSSDTSGSSPILLSVTNTNVGKTGTLQYLGGTPVNPCTTSTVELAPVLSDPQVIPLHGTSLSYVDYTVDYVDDNAGIVLVFTNGVDPPIVWKPAIQLPCAFLKVNIPFFVNCRSIAAFNGSLILGSITTTVDVETKQILWCDSGNFHDWKAGNSGNLLLGVQGPILRLIPYAGNLIVFSNKTIGSVYYANPDIIFGFQVNISDINLVGPDAVAVINPFLIYAAQDNIYIWDGGRTVSAIGDRIAPLWRSLQVSGYTQYARLFHDTTQGQVRLFVMTGASSYQAFIAEFSVTSVTFYDLQKSNRIRWFSQQYEVFPYCWGLTYNGSSNSQQVLIGTSGGVVLIEDGTDSSIDDNGNAITIQWDTGDFILPKTLQSQLGRWLELEFEAFGTSVDVSYSIDHGVSWRPISTVALTTTALAYKVFFDVTNRFVRFRFSNNSLGSQFNLSWYRVWYRAGGTR